MAELRPLRGVHYDWQRFDEPAQLVSPPFDVIRDGDEQHTLYARHPANAVRLVFNRNPESGPDNRYDNAREHWQRWLSEGTFTRDDAESFYVYHQTFDIIEPMSGRERRITRRGFIGRVRLHTYDEQIVLPHEQSLPRSRADRLALTRHVGAQLSPIFLLYNDLNADIDAGFARAILGVPPMVRFTTHDDGIIHTLWRITHPALLESTRHLFIPQRLLIADGHARYETALQLLKEAEAEGPVADDDPRRYIMAYFANDSDPGLILHPTHRVLHHREDFDIDTLLTRLEAHFEVTPQPDVDTLSRNVHDLRSEHHAMGLITRDLRCWSLARRRDAERLTIQAPEALRGLDVSLLHEQVLKRDLGMTEEDFDLRRHLHYVDSVPDALEHLQQPGSQAAFLLNPSRIDEVRSICLSGVKMPHKSTFFYPKVPTGLVFNPLSGD